MLLNVIIEGRQYQVELDPAHLAEAEPMFASMDADMDRGWQMGRQFIEQPDKIQRAQIAAHRLMLALEQNKGSMAQAMAGYIVARLSGVTGVDVDTSGELENTRFFTS
jgi:hypothetical protein